MCGGSTCSVSPSLCCESETCRQRHRFHAKFAQNTTVNLEGPWDAGMKHCIVPQGHVPTQDFHGTTR